MVYINNQKNTHLALSLNGSYIAYDGHSNFGIGFNFKDAAASSIQNDFMNLGESLIAINWKYMRAPEGPHGQGLPNFNIEWSEYAQYKKNNKIKYKAWRYFSPSIKRDGGTWGNILESKANWYATKKPSGIITGRLKLRNRKKEPRWKFHYYEKQGKNRRMIASAGNADMPSKKRWKKIFLNSCSSAYHYYFKFNRGTLFYNIKDCSSGNTTKIFVEGVIKEQSDKKIWNRLDGSEPAAIPDYHKF